MDADIYGGAVAVCLGITDAPGDLPEVAQLVNQGALDGLRLRSVTQVAALGRGSGRAAARHGWTAIRPATQEPLLGLFRRTFTLTVLDLAATLEEDERPVHDHVHLRRNAVTRIILQRADVEPGEPFGIPQPDAAPATEVASACMFESETRFEPYVHSHVQGYAAVALTRIICQRRGCAARVLAPVLGNGR